MSKFILLSIIFAMVIIPTRAARMPNPQEGLRRVVIQMLLFEVFYAFALRFLWGRI